MLRKEIVAQRESKTYHRQKSIGGWIGEVIFDMMSNYDLALIISWVVSVAGAVSIVLLEPTNRLFTDNWETEFLPESGIPAEIAANKADTVIQL